MIDEYINNLIQNGYFRGHNVYILCPVRKVSEDVKMTLDNLVNTLDEFAAHVHYPHRDTHQEDNTGGYFICKTNVEAIKDAEIVLLYWDKTSTGSHFDLGAIFSEYIDSIYKKRKPIRIIILNEEDMNDTADKSFEKVIKYLANVTQYTLVDDNNK